MNNFLFALLQIMVIGAPTSFVTCMILSNQHDLQHIDNIRARVDDLNEKDLLDGEVLITQGDRILFHGMSRDVRSCSSSGRAAQFMIASVSKQFTAVALLKALYEVSLGVNEKERCDHVILQLHRPLIDYLTPEVFAWGPSVPRWAHEVTLYHLLTHTGGLVQHIRILFETEGHEAVQAFMHKGHGPEYIMQRWGHEPLQFPPGSEFSYSNVGYELLARVVARVTKMSFEDYLQTRLFEPLGLNSTYQPSQGTSIQLSQLPHLTNLLPELLYHGPDGRSFVPQSDMVCDVGAAQGSGGIISTTQDLLRWNRALHEEKCVLPPILYDLCITPHKNSHGFGLWNRSGVVSYTGKFSVYTALLMYLPKHNLSIVGLWHKDQDEETIFQRIRACDSQLRETISDDKDRQERVLDLMKQTYPPACRGSAALLGYMLDGIQEVMK